MSKGVEGQQRKINDDQWCENTGSTNATALAADARFAADVEHEMTLWQGVKTYRKAVGWSILISAATTMDGYDTGFLTSLFGLVDPQPSIFKMDLLTDFSAYLSLPSERLLGFLKTGIMLFLPHGSRLLATLATLESSSES